MLCCPAQSPCSAIRRHCSTCSGSALEWPPDPFPARHFPVLSQLDAFAGRTHLISPLGGMDRRKNFVAALPSLAWCIRSSSVNEWAIYAEPLLLIEQESGHLSFREAFE